MRFLMGLLAAIFAFAVFAGGASAEQVISKATYVYKTVGNRPIEADVYRRPGKDTRPAIIWIHGGALIFGSRGTLRPDQLNRYLSAGYVVVSIDYRLAPETKLPDIIEDVRDAYRWVRKVGAKSFFIDPDRIALVGNSAGGYLAMMVGASVKPRPRALVSFYGYADLAMTARAQPHYLNKALIDRKEAYKLVGKAIISESEIYPRVIFYNYCKQNGLWPREVGGFDPDTQVENFAKYSPIRFVSKDYPPTMLLHGDEDEDVGFEESVRMAAALKAIGVPQRLIRMRGYNHLFDVFSRDWPNEDAKPIGLADPKVAAAYDEVSAFLGKHLGR